MSKFSVLAVGKALLDSFEKIHGAGYTYNDLKPDNILVGDHPVIGKDKSKNVFRKTTINLIDFGFGKKYRKNGQHNP